MLYFNQHILAVSHIMSNRCSFLLFLTFLLQQGTAGAQQFQLTGSLKSKIGNLTYVGITHNKYFVSFVTRESEFTSAGLPIPSLFYVDCSSISFNGPAAFNSTSRDYVKDLIKQFCREMKSENESLPNLT